MERAVRFGISLAAAFKGETPKCARLSSCVTAALVVGPMSSIVKAEDTTIIKRDSERNKTVIKKREELNVLPVPHTEEKTIIKKEHERE
jgi:hypothetical protein